MVPSQPSSQRRAQLAKAKDKRQVAKANAKMECPLAPSPFAPLATELPPWPAQDTTTSNLLPTGTVPTPHQVVETLAQKREVVQALKNAYPDHATVPPDTKDLIEKMEKDIEKLEKENSKSTTKNLHSATTALGKAQKTLTEALDARRAHRLRWTKHIADAVKLWESQLHEYRQQQASFQEVASKARADIEFARSAIQTLSTKATTATLASMPPITPISAETEDLVGDADPETEKVQQQLQNILQSCAAALWVEMQGAESTTAAVRYDGFERRGGRPARQGYKQKAACLRTLWWWCCILSTDLAEAVKLGGALLVPSNSLHDATVGAPGVEAYVTVSDNLHCLHAACTEQLSDFDCDRFLHWKHSILHNPKYRNPFTAVLTAWHLRWNILCESFGIDISRLNDLSNCDGHVCFETLDAAERTVHEMAVCSCLHIGSFHCDVAGQLLPTITCCIFLPIVASDVVAKHVLPAKLRSCIKPSNAFDLSDDHCSMPKAVIPTQSQTRHVSFQEDVQILVGFADELNMTSCSMCVDDLKHWKAKTMVKKTTTTISTFAK